MTATKAPWSPEEVRSLNEYQFSGAFHPFTCPSEHLKIVRTTDGGQFNEDDFEEVQRLNEFYVMSEHVTLVAFEDGWRCPGELCDYRQDWAHDWMLNGQWRPEWMGDDS